uniref:Sesquipedalian n=1 Tax=Ficedula albicollis TaxID=59894 RepID=U3K302_FICAL
MKLNERSLAFYATCDSPADNAGFLYKRGERHTAYHRRWFVLKGNMLFYFEERDSREPVGVIVLEGCNVELCDAAENYTFAIRFGGTKSRTYVLAAENQAAMESWVKSLSRASFDYMRLVVRELEKQLQEMSRGLAGGCAGSRGPPGLCKPQSRPPALPAVPPKENGCAVWNNVLGAERRASNGEAASAGAAVAQSPSAFYRLHEQYRLEVTRLRQDWEQRRRGPRP